jgi:hypothetical protein
MKSKIFSFSLVAVFTSNMASAQAPVITNCENFTIGTVLKFQKCNPSSVFAGSNGAGVIWDFTSLAALPDTTTEWMVAPASTSHGSLFPNSNLVEKYSDGTFVYVNMNADSSFLVGYVDTINNYTIHYPNSLLFALRPITYGANVTDTFTINFASPGFNFNGSGIASIVSDGYGTLKLPNGVFNNTLRLKITQVQNDTLIPGGSLSTSATVSYTWFDTSHTSALLKIDSTNTGATVTKTVQYLIQEAVEGVQQLYKDAPLSFFPNPAKDVLHISPCAKGQVSVINSLGQMLITAPVDERETYIPISQLPRGIYCLAYTTQNSTQTFRLVVL